jgi:hypothetical protein
MAQDPYTLVSCHVLNMSIGCVSTPFCVQVLLGCVMQPRLSNRDCQSVDVQSNEHRACEVSLYCCNEMHILVQDNVRISANL